MHYLERIGIGSDDLDWEPEKHGKQRRAALKHEYRRIIEEEVLHMEEYVNDYMNMEG